VVWRQNSLKRENPSWPDNSDELSWDDFRAVLNKNQAAFDTACETTLSGPIEFNLDSKDGSAMRLPHLAVLKNLTQTLGSRMVLALHDSDQDAAWSNLFAATRLVTAWNPEPAEISHLVRFVDTKLVFDETWQALQTNHWPDEKLARLQTEWEAANFLTNLPEVVAFTRASRIAAYAYDRTESTQPPMPFNEFLHETWPNPLNIWGEYRRRWSQGKYLHGGMYEDEKDVLLFYRDREVEQRNAVQAPTWMQMRQLPGVTNEIFFQSKYPSQVQAMMNLHRTSMAFQRQGSSFLGRAAEAEAGRRILITAIALERYRGKYGSYPKTLAEISPEFLKAPLSDFMDGKPLRYRLSDDSNFLLYSVGQGCVDDGGKFPTRPRNVEEWQINMGEARMDGSDIMWPLPASVAQAATQREQASKVRQEQLAQAEERGKSQEAQAEASRQTTVKKLLAMKPPFNTTEPRLEGKPLTQVLINPIMTGTKKLSVDELLSLKQIVTGEEPDIATFEVPVGYDALKDRGELRLSVDGGAGTELEDCTRATNGDCLLVWNTTYEPPGQHALQAQLLYHEKANVWHELDIKGPVAPFYSSNVVQFFEGNSMFTDKGASLYAKLPETNGIYSIELQTSEGKHLKTISGTTSNGVINVDWDLKDDQGNKYTGNTIKAVYNVTLPDSGRTQTLRGP
jgi:hypothetical protein